LPQSTIFNTYEATNKRAYPIICSDIQKGTHIALIVAETRVELIHIRLIFYEFLKIIRQIIKFRKIKSFRLKPVLHHIYVSFVLRFYSFFLIYL
jgi:hypothetical protein